VWEGGCCMSCGSTGNQLEWSKESAHNLCLHPSPLSMHRPLPGSTPLDAQCVTPCVAVVLYHAVSCRAVPSYRSLRCTPAPVCTTGSLTRPSAALLSPSRVLPGQTLTASPSWSCRHCWAAGTGTTPAASTQVRAGCSWVDGWLAHGHGDALGLYDVTVVVLIA
jgi:hypothetical protein